MRRVACVATILAAVLGAHPRAADAGSPDAAAAEAAYERADFEQAITLFARVLSDPDATRAEIVTAHRFLLALDAARDDAPGATSHAIAALALDPATALPEGAPPTALAALERARDERRGRVVRVAVTLEPEAATGARGVHAEAHDVPAAPGARLLVRCEVAGREVASGESAEASLALVVPARVPGSVLVCDAELVANERVVLERATVRAAAVGAWVAPRHAPTRGGVPWGAIVGVGLGAVAVGAVVAVLAVVLGAPDHTQLGPPRFGP